MVTVPQDTACHGLRMFFVWAGYACFIPDGAQAGGNGGTGQVQLCRRILDRPAPAANQIEHAPFPVGEVAAPFHLLKLLDGVSVFHIGPPLRSAPPPLRFL